MAMGIWLPGGGGADLDAVTASAGDVLAGKVIVGPDGEPLTGTLALSGSASDGQVLGRQTYYNTDAKTKRIGTMPNRGAVSQSLAINGSYTIPAGYHNGSGKVTQSVPTKGEQTYTPGRSNQTIGSNQWLSGAQTILGDPNLKPENIKKGVTIFGNVGTHEGYVTSPLYLFNNGTWGGLQTTGMTEVTDKNGGGYIEIGSSIEFGGRRGKQDILNARLNQKFNLTSYKYIKIRAEYYYYSNYIMIGVSDSPNAGLGGYIASTKVNNPNGGYYILDVSSISGEKYIYLEASTDHNFSNNSSDVVIVHEIMVTNN
ncbi:MAG: hypothetical protein UF433_05355 [Clostridium sp.]|nr:hypothetical protein [Clostridium sp.]